MAKGSPKIPRFLSTHPENYDRQERLISHIEEVLAHCSFDLIVPRRLQREPKRDVEKGMMLLQDDFGKGCGEHHWYNAKKLG